MKKLAATLLFVFLGCLVIADVDVDPLQDCCYQIHSSVLHISNTTNEIVKTQKELISTIKEIELNPTINVKAPTQKESKGSFTIIGSLLGALLSGFAAIFVFWLRNRKDNNMKKMELKLLGHELYYFMDNIVSNMNSQVATIKELIESLKDGTYKHIILKRVVMNHVQRAKSFETNKTFSTFQYLGLPPKKFINYYSHLDFLFELLTAVDNDIEMNNSKVVTLYSNAFIESRNEALILITDYIGKCVLEKKTDDAFFKYLNNKIIEYHTNAKPEPDISYDLVELIRPLKVDLLRDFRDREITNGILTLLKKAGDIAFSIKDSNRKLLDDIHSQIENIEGSIRGIEEIKNDFEPIYNK